MKEEQSNMTRKKDGTNSLSTPTTGQFEEANSRDSKFKDRWDLVVEFGTTHPSVKPKSNYSWPKLNRAQRRGLEPIGIITPGSVGRPRMADLRRRRQDPGIFRNTKNYGTKP